MSHFTDIELHRWAKFGPGEDASRLVEHLATCEECSRRYAKVIREQPLPAEEAGDVREFVAAGYRAGKSRSRWMWPAAAAAILILLIGIPLMRRGRETDDEIHLRGAGIQALTPSGDVKVGDIVFTWASGVATPRVAIKVYDVKGEIYTTTTEQTRMPMPPELRPILQPGINYWWSVSALDSSGRPLASSDRRAFTVRPE